MCRRRRRTDEQHDARRQVCDHREQLALQGAICLSTQEASADGVEEYERCNDAGHVQ